MPTEAEWEYATRGGTNNSGFLYSGSDTVGDVAWYSVNSTPAKTNVVKSKTANALKLYDMSGNVWELCWDLHGNYSGGAQTNLMGATSGSNRVIRGGCFYSDADNCLVAYRYYYDPSVSGGTIGFRVVRSQ